MLQLTRQDGWTSRTPQLIRKYVSINTPQLAHHITLEFEFQNHFTPCPPSYYSYLWKCWSIFQSLKCSFLPIIRCFSRTRSSGCTHLRYRTRIEWRDTQIPLSCHRHSRSTGCRLSTPLCSWCCWLLSSPLSWWESLRRISPSTWRWTRWGVNQCYL